MSVASAIEETTAGAARLSEPAALYWLLAAAAIVLLWPTGWTMVGQWASSSTYHHGFLVAPVALWLILREPRAPARAYSPALLGVAGGGLLWLLGRAASVNLAEQLGLVSVLIAAAVALFGPRWARRCAFPLALLYFMVPFGDSALPALQRVAALGTMALLGLFKVEAWIDGLIIATSAGRFEIAEACAGLNFLLASLLVAAVFARMALHSWAKRAAFVAVALAAAIGANILRAFLVIAIETWSKSAIPIAADHLLFGWGLYAVVIVAVIAIGRRLAEGEAVRIDVAPCAGPRAREPVARVWAAALGLLVLFSLYAALVVARPPLLGAPDALPLMSANGWAPSAPKADAAHLTGDAILRARYLSGDRVVDLEAAYVAGERNGVEIAAVHARLRGQSIESAAVFGEVMPVAFGRIGGADAAALYWLGDRFYANASALKIAQAQHRLLGRNPRGGVILVVSEGPPAKSAIRDFLRDVEPLSRWLARIDAGGR
jgi:exosortase A